MCVKSVLRKNAGCAISALLNLEWSFGFSTCVRNDGRHSAYNGFMHTYIHTYRKYVVAIKSVLAERLVCVCVCVCVFVCVRVR